MWEIWSEKSLLMLILIRLMSNYPFKETTTRLKKSFNETYHSIQDKIGEYEALKNDYSNSFSNEYQESHSLR